MLEPIQFNEKQMNIEELKGVGKILDILWTNSYYSMGKLGSERIETELIYYFGKNWTTDMYKLIEEKNKAHFIEPVKTLKEIKYEHR